MAIPNARLAWSRLVLGAACVLLPALPASARADVVELVAGGGSGGDGSPAASAKLTGPFGVDFDRDGLPYFVEMTGNRLRRIDGKGAVVTVVGELQKGDVGDGGPGT